MKKFILIIMFIFSVTLVGCNMDEPEKDYSLQKEMTIVEEIGIEEILNIGNSAYAQFSSCDMLEVEATEELKTKNNYGVIVYTEKNVIEYAFNNTKDVKSSLEGKLYQTVDNVESLRLINMYIKDGVLYEKDINSTTQNYNKNEYSNETLKTKTVLYLEEIFKIIKLSPNAILTAGAYDSVNEGTWISCGKDTEGNIIVQGKLMAERLGLETEEFVEIRVVINDGKFVYAECKSTCFKYYAKFNYKKVKCDLSKLNEEQYQ